MESPSNSVALPVEQNLIPQEPNPASNELSPPRQKLAKLHISPKPRTLNLKARQLCHWLFTKVLCTSALSREKNAPPTWACLLTTDSMP